MKWIYIVVLGIVLASGVAGLFYIAMQKNSEIIVVTVTLARPPDNDTNKIIKDINATFEYTTKLNAPKETPLELPGITVIISQNKMEISDWHSVPIPREGSIYGSYNISVGITGKFNRTQPVDILARVVDPAGKDLAVSRSYTMI